MSEEYVAKVRAEVARRLGENSGFGATLKLNLNGDGIVYVDGKSQPNRVTDEDLPADCTIRVSLADFRALVDGRLEGTTAFLMGRLKVEGNMAIAMKLGPLLGRK